LSWFRETLHGFVEEAARCALSSTTSPGAPTRRAVIWLFYAAHAAQLERSMVKYLELAHNGDPYGSGFTATGLENRGDTIGVYFGDIGAKPRAWWRAYARRNGYVLIEVR
jgi:hypothetical protein